MSALVAMVRPCGGTDPDLSRCNSTAAKMCHFITERSASPPRDLSWADGEIVRGPAVEKLAYHAGNMTLFYHLRCR